MCECNVVLVDHLDLDPTVKCARSASRVSDEVDETLLTESQHLVDDHVKRPVGLQLVYDVLSKVDAHSHSLSSSQVCTLSSYAVPYAVDPSLSFLLYARSCRRPVMWTLWPRSCLAMSTACWPHSTHGT